MWEYKIVEEGNPVSLQDRLGTLANDGWEAISLTSAAEFRLLALVRRRVPPPNDSERSTRDHAV
jgi:hypothetical protein